MAVTLVTGGGASAISWLLEVPGASRTLLEARVPYGATSLSELLGYRPVQAVSDSTAMDLARIAFEQAVSLRPKNKPVVGIGCTAAIASDRPKSGAHRCHVAAWDADGATIYSLELVKGLRDRAREDRVVGRILLRAIADAFSVDFDVPMDLDPDERIHISRLTHDEPIGRLLAGKVRTVTLFEGGEMLADQVHTGGVLSGSFNPLHEAHLRLAEVAAGLLNQAVVFELSVENVDKPPLAEVEIRGRLAQFAGNGAVVVTGARTFHEKAKLFPGCTFVIGFDTARRLFDPVYHSGSEKGLLDALSEIRAAGCSFLVAGRAANGRFQTLADVAVPHGFDDLLEPIPESKFRIDKSSSAIRAAAAGS